MEKCQTLQEYSVLIGKVKEYLKAGADRNIAIKQAVEWCIEHQVLREFLTTEKAEVISMILEEYDEQAHMRMIREAALQEGIGIGYEQAQSENEEKIRQINKKNEETVRQLNEANEEKIRQLEEVIALLQNQNK